MHPIQLISRRCTAQHLRTLAPPHTPASCRRRSPVELQTHTYRKQATCSASSSSNPATVQELPSRLAIFYDQLQNPALADRPYSKSIQDFTDSSILAYECGYTEESLKQQLIAVMQHQVKQEVTELTEEQQQIMDGCVACASIIWITLMTTPKAVTRWAQAEAVSQDTMCLWRGFVSMIVIGYFEKGLAGYPLDRLQLEVSAVQGRAVGPDLVDEWSRLVYTTLEKVHPMWPKD